MHSSSDAIQLVIFDWAGTTVDFGCRAPAAAFVETFAAFGVEVSLAEARGPMGLGKKDHIRVMLQQPALAQRWLATHGRPWTEADVEALYRDVTPRQIEAAERLGQPVPGLLDCIAELRRRGIKIGGTTGYFREAAEAAQRTAAQHGYVPDFSACIDDVPAGRPAPWMAFRVMEVLNVYPPARVLKVGDTSADIDEGRNAGAWAVNVIDSSNAMGLSAEELAELSAEERTRRRDEIAQRFQKAGAHAAIKTLGDLPEMIDRLNVKIDRGKLSVADPGGVLA